MEKEECQKIFEEYKKLRSKIDKIMEAKGSTPSDHAGNVLMAPTRDDFSRLQELKTILINCKECLNMNPNDSYRLFE